MAFTDACEMGAGVVDVVQSNIFDPSTFSNGNAGCCPAEDGDGGAMERNGAEGPAPASEPVIPVGIVVVLSFASDARAA